MMQEVSINLKLLSLKFIEKSDFCARVNSLSIKIDKSKYVMSTKQSEVNPL